MCERPPQELGWATVCPEMFVQLWSCPNTPHPAASLSMTSPQPGPPHGGQDPGGAGARGLWGSPEVTEGCRRRAGVRLERPRVLGVGRPEAMGVDAHRVGAGKRQPLTPEDLLETEPLGFTRFVLNIHVEFLSIM